MATVKRKAVLSFSALSAVTALIERVVQPFTAPTVTGEGLTRPRERLLQIIIFDDLVRPLLGDANSIPQLLIGQQRVCFQ
jgi:hypothetical protein|tara:strand:+ start:987 stop:1226 length:240 start_codon:yes stop_codon:yes gene_type:complete